MNSNPSATKKILVATLDILGMSQLMQDVKAAELDAMAGKIKKVFDLATNCVENTIGKLLDDFGKPKAIKEAIVTNVFKSAIRFNNFSDTIVISCDVGNVDFAGLTRSLNEEVDDTSKKIFQDAAVQLFGIQVLFSTSLMFHAGFPVRGCVDVGDVYVSEKLIVGKVYVDSLRFGESLDFSGVVITDAALNFCKEYEGGCIHGKAFTVNEMYVPIRGHDSFQKCNCMNWTLHTPLLPDNKKFSDSHDWKQLLYEKFAANGKSMTESALRKMENTENTIRAFIMQSKAMLPKEKKCIATTTNPADHDV